MQILIRQRFSVCSVVVGSAPNHFIDETPLVQTACIDLWRYSGSNRVSPEVYYPLQAAEPLK